MAPNLVRHWRHGIVLDVMVIVVVWGRGRGHRGGGGYGGSRDGDGGVGRGGVAWGIGRCRTRQKEYDDAWGLLRIKNMK